MKEKFLKICPICNSDKLKKNYQFENFYILNCHNCGNAWRSNMYDEEKIEEIYCIDNYEDNPYFLYEIDMVLNMKNNRFKNYKQALDFLKASHIQRELLDIGCGTGTFLALAKRYGWNLTGIEISEKLSEKCKQNVPEARIITKRFEDADLEEGQFSLITMWDVIEHVIDPVEVISRIKNLLVAGGIALFCTPDESSFLAKVGKVLYNMNISSPALALHPTNHTYFFSRKGFEYIIKDLDMQVHKMYSQNAFFEHSEMASRIQKVGISMIEKVSGIADARYEMVIMARKKG